MPITRSKSVRINLALAMTIFLFMAFSACDAAFDLNENPEKSQLAALPYESLTELEEAVTGVYHQLFPVFRKIVGPFEDEIFKDYETSRGDYLMRYAEVLLIYAEASGRAGDVSAAAWEALNMVWRRAEGLPINTPDPNVDLSNLHGDIEELAFTEKKWELAGEYLRWFDLIRLERVEEALGGTARDPRVSIGSIFNSDGIPIPIPLTEPSIRIEGPLGTDHYFDPIPPSEILQLPNLRG